MIYRGYSELKLFNVICYNDGNYDSTTVGLNSKLIVVFDDSSTRNCGGGVFSLADTSIKFHL